MTKKMNNKKETKTQRILELQKENRELKAQLCHAYHFAAKDLVEMNNQRTMGSAVIIEIYTLGEKLRCGPVAIRDGLSDETIKALINDLKRSYESCIELKP